MKETIMILVWSLIVILIGIVLTYLHSRRFGLDQLDLYPELQNQILKAREDNDITRLQTLEQEIKEDVSSLKSHTYKESDPQIYELRGHLVSIHTYLSRIDKDHYLQHIEHALTEYDQIRVNEIHDPMFIISVKLHKANILYQQGENEHNAEALHESVKILQQVYLMINGHEKQFDGGLAWTINQFLGCAQIFHPNLFIQGGKEWIEIYQPGMVLDDEEKRVIEEGIHLNKKATALYIEKYGYETLPDIIAVKICAGWRLLHPQGV